MSMIGYNPALMKQLAGTKKKPGSLTNPAGTPYVVGSANGKMPQSTSPLDPEQAAATAEKPAPAASPLVPGVPVAGPGVMTPAQVNSTLPAPQRIADLQAKESTYRQAIVNPSVSPAERMMAKEKVAALAAERRALENSSANGPKFLDANAAANSTQKLLEQTLTQMRDQIGRPEVDQSSLEKRFNDTAAELEKVKSGAYAQEYNSPERVAAREAAMQKHLARQKAYADEANRLADTRMQGEAEVAKQRELKDAAMQAQLAGIQQGTQAGDLGNQRTQAEIDRVRATIDNNNTLTQAQKDKLAFDLKLGAQRLKMGEIEIADNEATANERRNLLKNKLGAATSQSQLNQFNAEGDLKAAQELNPLERQSRVFMERARLGYGAAGFTDRADMMNKAKDIWEKSIKPGLGGISDADNVVTGTGWTGLGGSFDPKRVDDFHAAIIGPITRLQQYAPEEAKLVAADMLRRFPPDDFVGHNIGGSGREETAAKLNEIKNILKGIVGV